MEEVVILEGGSALTGCPDEAGCDGIAFSDEGAASEDAELRLSATDGLAGSEVVTAELSSAELASSHKSSVLTDEVAFDELFLLEAISEMADSFEGVEDSDDCESSVNVEVSPHPVIAIVAINRALIRANIFDMVSTPQLFIFSSYYHDSPYFATNSRKAYRISVVL